MSKGDLNTARLEGANGTLTINDTTAVIANFNSIQVVDSTVIAILEIGGSSVLANYVTTPATAIASGIITCPYGQFFSKIQLTSGQVIIGLK